MPRRNSEHNHHRIEQPAIEREAEECLRNTQQNYTLCALHNADFGVDAQCFSAGSGVADHVRSDDSEKTHGQHWPAMVDRMRGVEVRDATEQGAVGDAVQGRIVERTKYGHFPCFSGNYPIECVGDCGKPDDPAPQPHVTVGKGNASDNSRQRTYGSKCIG